LNKVNLNANSHFFQFFRNFDVFSIQLLEFFQHDKHILELNNLVLQFFSENLSSNHLIFLFQNKSRLCNPDLHKTLCKLHRHQIGILKIQPIKFKHIRLVGVSNFMEDFLALSSKKTDLKRTRRAYEGALSSMREKRTVLARRNQEQASKYSKLCKLELQIEEFVAKTLNAVNTFRENDKSYQEHLLETQMMEETYVSAFSELQSAVGRANEGTSLNLVVPDDLYYESPQNKRKKIELPEGLDALGHSQAGSTETWEGLVKLELAIWTV
jgi:hypothetical protein